MAKIGPEENLKPEAVKQAEKEVGAKALAVYNNKGMYIRTYTAEIHGARFKELAEEFAQKKDGTVKRVG